MTGKDLANASAAAPPAVYFAKSFPVIRSQSDLVSNYVERSDRVKVRQSTPYRHLATKAGEKS